MTALILLVALAAPADVKLADVAKIPDVKPADAAATVADDTDVDDDEEAQPAPTSLPPPTAEPLPPFDDSDLTRPMGAVEMMGSFVRGMLMLCVVLFIAWLTLSKGLGKLVEKAQSGKRVKVIERVSLDARHSLFLVEVDGKEMVFGSNGIEKLHELSAPPKKSFEETLGSSPTEKA